MRDTILVAGATGDLGTRIALALRGRGAAVTAPVRPGSAAERLAPLQAAGVNVIPLDLDDEAAVTAACRGASCVVSALNGLEPVILGTQGVLLRAAVAAGAPRFIPSDFSLDFTKTAPGTNRNLDLRRAFHEVLDRAPIWATSVLNGGFAELLAGPAPFILFKPRRVLCWGDPDQPLELHHEGRRRGLHGGRSPRPHHPAHREDRRGGGQSARPRHGGRCRNGRAVPHPARRERGGPITTWAL